MLASPPAPPPPRILPTGGQPPEEPPRKRRWLGWRLVVGCLIVLLVSGGAAAVAVLEQVNTVVKDLDQTRAIKVSGHALAVSSFGQPETLLLVGDDTRAGYKYYNAYVPNLANEMLLVRIDPSKPYISMLSLPRELWVPITSPTGVVTTNRFNSSYSYGATTLLDTIKSVTGLSVNHFIVTTFPQFENAINTLGCVYNTIDERYYNLNVGGATDYQSIDLQPGYQCLNGSEAEQFVSFRHADTSQIRDARDQSFLLAVKAQYGPLLSGNLGKFEKVFGQTVQTDTGLRSSSEILNLANLLVTAAGLKVRQVPFLTEPCTLSTCPGSNPASGNLYATSAQIAASVHNFLYGPDIAPGRHLRVSREELKKQPLTATVVGTAAGEETLASKLPFTAEFPRVQDAAGSTNPTADTCENQTGPCMRNYLIHAPDGDAYPAYVEAFSNGDLGQYYDVQGTTWTEAPLFQNPAQTVQIGRRTYSLFYSGSHIETVAWHEYGAEYWVHNTLTNAVSNGEMLAIAAQTVPVGQVRKAPTHVILKAFSVPTFAGRPAAPTPITESIGRVGGIVVLIMLPIGLLIAILNWLRIRAMRDELVTSSGRLALLQSRAIALGGPALAGAGAASGGSVPVTGPPAGWSAGSDGGRRGLGARLAISLVGVLVLAAIAGGLYAVLSSNKVGQHRHHAAPLVPPKVAVAVLNAGTVPDAAHHLAVTLAHRHVHVVGTGNLSGTPTASYEVFYTHGERAQAKLLAALLASHHPQIAPINDATSAAVGGRPKLVVVIPSSGA